MRCLRGVSVCICKFEYASVRFSLSGSPIVRAAASFIARCSSAPSPFVQNLSRGRSVVLSFDRLIEVASGFLFVLYQTVCLYFFRLRILRRLRFSMCVGHQNNLTLHHCVVIDRSISVSLDSSLVRSLLRSIAPSFVLCLFALPRTVGSCCLCVFFSLVMDPRWAFGGCLGVPVVLLKILTSSIFPRAESCLIIQLICHMIARRHGMIRSWDMIVLVGSGNIMRNQRDVS